MKEGEFMKANYNRNSKDILLSGQGEEWSEISRDISVHVQAWLEHSGINDDMIKDILKSDNINLDVVTVNDDRGVALIIDNVVIGCPLIYEGLDKKYNAESFITDCTLFFLHLKSEYAQSNKQFESAIRDFFSKASDNAKLLRTM